MASFYLCNAPACNKKYKTLHKLQDHALRVHATILDESGAHLEVITSENKKQVERAHTARIKKEASEVLMQRALQLQEAQEAARQAHMLAEVERYKHVQEEALRLQEEDVLTQQRQIEAHKANEAVLIELEARYRENALRSTDVCCMCIDEPRDWAVIPCGHRAFCMSCITGYRESNPQKGCPICRAEIVLVCRIYT